MTEYATQIIAVNSTVILQTAPHILQGYNSTLNYAYILDFMPSGLTNFLITSCWQTGPRC